MKVQVDTSSEPPQEYNHDGFDKSSLVMFFYSQLGSYVNIMLFYNSTRRKSWQGDTWVIEIRFSKFKSVLNIALLD